MRRKTATVGVVVVTLVVLVASALVQPVGAAAASGDGAYRYTFEFEERGAAFEAVDGHTEEGNVTTVALQVPHANVTWLRLIVTWRDDVGEPDEVALSAKDPQGAGHGPVADNASQGRVELFVPLAEAPEGNITITTESDGAAWRELLDRKPPWRASTGEWDARVEVRDAGDVYVLGSRRGNDSGNAWRLEGDYGYYVAVLDGKAPVEAQETPAPGGGGGPGSATLGALGLLAGAAVGGSAAAVWLVRRWSGRG